jgi:hypothetical protein
MMKQRRIIKDYRQSGTLNSLLGVHAAVDDHTFLTKGGDLFSVLKTKGVDYEGLDPAQLDQHSLSRLSGQPGAPAGGFEPRGVPEE